MTREWKRGDIVPLENLRGIVGHEICPTWHALKVPPMRERKTVDYLKERGVHSCYPTRDKVYRLRGKSIKRQYPIITQIVYAKFRRAPQWDILKARKLITGVFSYGDRPIVIPKDIIAGVMGLPTEAERLEQARRELMRVREGDKASLIGGPLSGAVVDVTRVSEGRIWFETLTGIKGSADPAAMERKLG